MIRPALLLVLPAFGLATDLSAAPKGKFSRIGELPGEKSPATLPARERNPFVRRETKAAEPTVDAASEESKLRDRLATMTVTGVVRGGDTPTVLLEGLILKPGRPLPPLIEDQTERLAVSRITDAQLEIVFIENDERAEPRRIVVPIDLRPRVTVRLAPAAESPKKPSP